MSKTKLKKHLLTLTKEQLIDLMLDLYSASKEANKWLEFYLEPNFEAELQKYKKAIHKQFFGSIESYPSFRECNKLVSSFQKLVSDPLTVADLLLYYVEQGCEFTEEYGDCDSEFYTALEINFYKAIKFMAKNGLLSKFAPRIKKMIKSVKYCGYGFPDHLSEMYSEFAEE